MSAQELRQRYLDLLMEQIGSDQYPSGEMMARVERTIADLETAEQYIGLLLENVSKDRYPSPGMLDRISTLIEQLGAIEARQDAMNGELAQRES